MDSSHEHSIRLMLVQLQPPQRQSKRARGRRMIIRCHRRFEESLAVLDTSMEMLIGQSINMMARFRAQP